MTTQQAYDRFKALYHGHKVNLGRKRNPISSAKTGATLRAKGKRREFWEANGNPQFTRAEYQWAWHLWTHYRITVRQYDEMFEQQGGVCAICFRPPRTNRLHVDHDHGTNQIRGLLCAPCNRHVGYLENLGRREQLLAYLRGREVSVPS